MPEIEKYLQSLPRKNDPTFEPPCCPEVEKKYLSLFTDPNIKFDYNDGIFFHGSQRVGKIIQHIVVGGQEWEPVPDISGEKIIIIKNPDRNHFLFKLVGENNGLTLINDTLYALAPYYNGLFQIRRPIRPSHLPVGSLDLVEQFERYSRLYSSPNTILTTS